MFTGHGVVVVFKLGKAVANVTNQKMQEWCCCHFRLARLRHSQPALGQAPVCLKEVTRKAEVRQQQSHTQEAMFVQ
jgi:hypothetical protein